MKLSYQWLKEIIPDLKKSPKELGEILSERIAEVENIFNLSKGLEKIIVAEVLNVKSHPNADKLKIAIVDTGKEKKQIVCGAPNLSLGQKVALAPEGSCLPNGMEIKKVNIRGVESKGMICAEDELGLGKDHQGIMVLPSDLKKGEKLIKALNRDDVILEIENKALTHRPDLWSHWGIAREIGAVLDLKINFKKTDLENKFKNKVNKNLFNFKIEDKEKCRRYMGVVIDDVKVKSSPKWLKNRLRNLGIKPINNLVDITNYVLLETGQPLHAFDADKIKSNKIVVRSAKKGEDILALNDEKYKLSSSDLVITDEEKPIALAGIIGGKNSEITNKTKKIIIESANFDATSVRRTSWELGLRTEAVIRFEKNLPLILTEQGMSQAIELIKELADGKVVSSLYDFKSLKAKNELKKKKEIIFDLKKAEEFIGLKINQQKIKKILENLGAQVKKKNQDFLVVPPNFRVDIELFEDLVEEVVRVYGPNKIEPKPILSPLKPQLQNKEYNLENHIKNILIGIGFNEVYNYSFANDQEINYFQEKKEKRELINPLKKEEKYLRQSLIPKLVFNAENNQRYFSEFMIFEIGRVFDPKENKRVSGLIFKPEKEVRQSKKNIYQNVCEKKCFFIKNVVDLILNRIGIDLEKIIYPSKLSLKEDIKYQDKVIGFLGKNKDSSYFELYFDCLVDLPKKEKKYQKIINYPLVKRDLAFLLSKDVSWKEIYQTVKKVDDLIVDLVPFDIFQDKNFGDKCNFGFRIVYQSKQGTLNSEEINKIEKKVIRAMEEKFKAQLRDF